MHTVRVNDNKWADAYEPVRWLRECVGPSHYRTNSGKREHNWVRRYYKNDIWIYSFERPEDATLFNLRWA